MSVSASSVCIPSTAQYRARHMPYATTHRSTVTRKLPAMAGPRCGSGRAVQPEASATRLATASPRRRSRRRSPRSGRSPGASGFERGAAPPRPWRGRARSRAPRGGQTSTAGAVPRGRAAAPCAAYGLPSAPPDASSSAALSAAAAARGSSASRMARTTTTREAPAAITSRTLSRSMPPIANQGRPRACAAAYCTYGARRPAGPPSWASPRPAPRSAGRPRRGQRRVELRRRVRGEADQHVRAGERAGLGRRHVVLPHVHAIRAAAQRPGRAGRSARRGRRARHTPCGTASPPPAARSPAPACRGAGPCPPRRRRAAASSSSTPGRTSVTKYSRAAWSRSRR